MKRFFESVVRYDKTGEDGNIAKVSELFIIDAMSCSETEAVTLKNVQPFVSGDCEVSSIKLAKYSEYIPADEMTENPDRYFAVKVSFITLDEVKGKEKKTAQHYLVNAGTVQSANARVVRFMRDTLADYEINNIVETKIVDVILHD